MQLKSCLYNCLLFLWVFSFLESQEEDGDIEVEEAEGEENDRPYNLRQRKTVERYQAPPIGKRASELKSDFSHNRYDLFICFNLLPASPTRA